MAVEASEEIMSNHQDTKTRDQAGLQTRDTSNKFAVGVKGDGRIWIILVHRLIEPISKDDALNLAAWLVALTDPEGKEFGKILEVIRKS